MGFGRRAEDPEGAPSQDLGQPGETSRTDSTFRGRESDPKPYYSTIAGSSRDSPKPRPLSQVGPLSQPIQKKPGCKGRCFKAGSDVLCLAGGGVRAKLSAPAQAAERKMARTEAAEAAWLMVEAEAQAA